MKEKYEIAEKHEMSEKGDKGTEKSDGKEEKEENKYPPVGVIQLFRHASVRDRLLIVFGVLAASICGCGMPAMVILFGDLLNAFVSNGFSDGSLEEELKKTLPDCFDGETILSNCTELLEKLTPQGDYYTEITKFGGGTALVGLVMWILSYFFVTTLNYAAESQVFRIRGMFLKAVLRQDVGWYDTNQTSDFAAKMTENLNKLQEGIGEKIGMFVFFMSTFLSSIITAFVFGWELTLVIFSVAPILMVAGGIMAKAQTALTEKELEAYGKAGVVAEEVLSAVRTVVAFGGQEKEVERYVGNLMFARRSGILRGMLTGASAGIVWFLIFSSYALAFWYGVKLIMDDREACIMEVMACSPRYDAKSLLVVFFSVLMGAMQVGQASPYVEAFAVARSVASSIYGIIERVPEVDSASTEGEKPESISGDIEFKDVAFAYPARPECQIFDGLNLKIGKGETVALVGPSGCGKSTCIQLLQRFYNLLGGKILLDGRSIDSLNVGWLREKIGVVGQEPVLFGCTIKENIKLGNEKATDEDVERACKNANAHDFIMNLPEKYNTFVGERGAQLSGGQKQRIAIARALVRNPKILLLDEATSALDTESESVVQEALDKAREGRTTVVVAHRLSTIRSANRIVAIENGVVVEEGTHEKLMLNKGLYFSLVTRQMKKTDDSGSSSSDSEEENEKDKEEELDPNRLADLPNGVEESFHRKGSRRHSLHRNGSRKSVRGHKSETMNSTGTVITKRDDEDEEVDEDLPKVSNLRILKTNGPEWYFIVIGALASMVMGAVMPVFAILFGDILGVLGYTDTQAARDDSVTYAIYFILVGVAAGAAMFFQSFMFAISGENLTVRMRRMAFEAMLRQEIGWFDEKKNSTGALCARLSSDASKIQGATGSRVGTVLQSIFTLIIALVIALYYSWKLGLVCSLFIPLLIGGIYLQMKIIMGHDTVEKEAFENSGKIAIEAITNIRTVIGLQCEQTFVDMYVEELKVPHKHTHKQSHIRGLIFGFAQAAPFFAYGAVMYYGGYLVREEGLGFDAAFKVAEALILGSFIVGQSVAFAPDYNKAMIAAGRIFSLLDRKPLIPCDDGSGLRLNEVKGNLSLRDATFHYPTRPEVKVLNRINAAVEPRQTVALVGSSGCGKSTVIQLLQRFYDLYEGSLDVENMNIQSLNVPWVRSRIGIVSQEPTLFDRTIAENIMYGDNAREVTMEEVISAARSANIHQFISNLPAGYDTRVGEKGTQLSGGQKQRIAIARALIRNPAVLLLDEATSALDTESEKIVQEALDKAQEDRTCITIAHRLSTIVHADKIIVISHGSVIEEGTHEELLKLQGKYYELWQKQG